MWKCQKNVSCISYFILGDGGKEEELILPFPRMVNSHGMATHSSQHWFNSVSFSYFLPFLTVEKFFETF